MGQVFEGNYIGTGLKVGIVIARFNDAIGKELLAGAQDTLVRHGVDANDIDIAWVPGGVEIPIVAKRLAASGNYDAVICLGVVIRGATTHYDYVAGGAASGVASVAMETGIPVLFGVITTENIEQAHERAGTKAGNYGSSTARSAIEMANLMKQLP